MAGGKLSVFNNDVDEIKEEATGNTGEVLAELILLNYYTTGRYTISFSNSLDLVM